MPLVVVEPVPWVVELWPFGLPLLAGVVVVVPWLEFDCAGEPRIRYGATNTPIEAMITAATASQRLWGMFILCFYLPRVSKRGPGLMGI